jgi:hypothetical protein
MTSRSRRAVLGGWPRTRRCVLERAFGVSLKRHLGDGQANALPGCSGKVLHPPLVLNVDLVGPFVGCRTSLTCRCFEPKPRLHAGLRLDLGPVASSSTSCSPQSAWRFSRAFMPATIADLPGERDAQDESRT